MRTRPDYQGSKLRWTLFYGREDNPHLLQTGLPRASGQGGKRKILCIGGSGRSSWIPAVPEVPAGNRSVLAGLERFSYNGRPCAAIDNGGGT
jgi:hypothetical protein